MNTFGGAALKAEDIFEELRREADGSFSIVYEALQEASKLKESKKASRDTTSVSKEAVIDLIKKIKARRKKA